MSENNQPQPQIIPTEPVKQPSSPNEKMEQQLVDEQPQQQEQSSSSDQQQPKLTCKPFTIITSKPLVKKELPKCDNKICSTPDSTVLKVESGPHHNLCQICDTRFKQGHYCYYCYQIYFEYADGKDWIMCDKCQKWIHCDCQQKHGDSNLKVKMSKNTDLSYYCPRCKPSKPILPNAKKQSSNAFGVGKQYKDPKEKNKFVKRFDNILNNYGFYWKLKPEQIQADLQKFRKM